MHQLMYNINKNIRNDKLKPMNTTFPFQHSKSTNKIYLYNCIIGSSHTKINLTTYM